MFSRWFAVTLGLVVSASAFGQKPDVKPGAKPEAARIPDVTPVHAPAMAFVALDDRMPITKLVPAVYVPELCTYRYRVGTDSAECQKFVDQALGYFYSYVWIETARSAETALKHDPNCAFAWLMLHRGIEKWGRGDANVPLKKAQELLPKAPHREQLLITAKLHEKGLMGGTPTYDEKRKKAIETLNEMLTVYDDDEEAWFARGAAHGGFQGGPAEGIVFYKALLRVNPMHPGANHELVHYHEGSRRPALGWANAEAYIASSPGIPHALHMQSHLAMRIGKWEKTSDRSWKAVELQREYHRVQKVKHSEDHQFSHHLETLTLSLVHDGRFAEVEEIRKESETYGYNYAIPWFRSALGRRDWEECEKLIAKTRKSDKNQAAYHSALMFLEKGEPAKAAPEVDVLRQASQAKKGDRRLENRFNEVQGLFNCMTGSGDAGIKLLKRNIDKTKDDYGHHAWGNGAVFMESWGIGALCAGNADEAEEAFLEALAHDAGSVRAALGLQALCERLNRTDEAAKYSTLARRLWAKANPADFEAIRSAMVRRAANVSLGATTGAAANLK
jgi:tetratricopeptide (TPR) repeat protein